MDELSIAKASLEWWEGTVAPIMIALVAIGVGYEGLALLIERPFEKTIDEEREKELDPKQALGDKLHAAEPEI